MIASKQDLKAFTASYIEEHLGYDRPVAEDLAQDFVNDDFPLNKIKTIAQASSYLDELLARIRPAAGQERS